MIRSRHYNYLCVKNSLQMVVIPGSNEIRDIEVVRSFFAI